MSEVNEKSEAPLSVAPGSVTPIITARDWHWTLRHFDTPLTSPCVCCGENIPETDNICDECREDETYG